MINIRTDLAVETREMYKTANKIEDEIPGIETKEEEIDENIKVTTVEIKTKEGEEAIRKANRNLHYNGHKGI